MRWLEGRIREYVALLRLMQPIARFRLALLVFDGLWVLFAAGYLFNALCLTYFIVSAIAMILYVLGLLIYKFR